MRVLVWDGVDSQYGGHHDIQLTLDVSLSERQAVFAMIVENHSELIVENVYCPYLGDVQPPPAAEWFKTFLYQYAAASNGPCGPTIKTCAAIMAWTIPPSLPLERAQRARRCPPIFCCAAQKGLYVGMCEPEQRAGRLAYGTAPRLYGSAIAFDVQATCRTVRHQRQGCGDSLRRRACPLYPAGRNARAHARLRWKLMRADGSTA